MLSFADLIAPKEILHHQKSFQNWGQTVTSYPTITFSPQNVPEISKIVTWAKNVGKNVRVAGYRHTWTDIHAQDGDVLISLLNSEDSKPSPFQYIELKGKPFIEDGKTKQLCRIGSATSNEQFRQWSVSNFTQGNQSWTVPLNVILVENTFGGTTSMMCHGAGIQNKTLSDLVTQIKFVNANGKLQTIGYQPTDTIEQQLEGKKLIKTAAGSMGQIGIITELTLKLDYMTHAIMNPSKPRLALTVPPPEGFIPPDFLPKSIMEGLTEIDFKKAREEFAKAVETSAYSEYFWFSLHSNGWVNCFKDNGDAKNSIDYPSSNNVKIQEIESCLAKIVSENLLSLMPPDWQAHLLSDIAMLRLPSDEKFTVPKIDALHFRRGIHEMPVQDMEWEIPIPTLPNGKLDWSICQRAWWDAIIVVYEWFMKKNKVPMRLPLEMRIMGGSDITLAAQKGNKATCSIEVLTVAANLIDKSEWDEFRQNILDKWATYTDSNGKPLDIRPHWAKQWDNLTIQRKGDIRKNVLEYVKEVYKDALTTFKEDLTHIAKKGGYSVNDLKIFSTPLLTKIFSEEKQNEEKKADSKIYSDSKKIVNSVNISKLHDLVLMLNKAYLAKEEFLALKIKKDISKIPIRKLYPVEPNNNDSKISDLIVNSWFSQGRKIMLGNQIALEQALKNRNEESSKSCLSCCTIS